MNLARWFVLALVLVPVACTSVVNTPSTKPAIPLVKADDVGDVLMGEYAGKFTPATGAASSAVARVYPLGDGQYGVLLMKGDNDPDPMQLAGKAAGDKLEFSNQAGDAKGSLVGGKTATATTKSGKYDLNFNVRKSPSEGAKPPEGAIVLLPFEEGKPTSMAEWTNTSWPLMPDGSIQAGKGGSTTTKRNFGDIKLHVEFKTSYEPKGRGQARGNSGVGLMDRYEIQVLDSFGVSGVADKGDCASVYGKVPPRVNAALPPLAWQTFDITFHAPRWTDGKMMKKPTVTVVWNGVTVQQDQEIAGPTGIGEMTDAKGPAPIQLQDHGHLVRFRNMWVVELKDAGGK